MGKRSTPYVGQTDRSITDHGLQNSSARTLPPYSVILSSRAPIGHLVINIEPMATNQGCKGLVPRGRIDHKFLYYYLGSIVDLLNDLGTGTTFKELSGGNLKAVVVPLPPLAEQRRIVAILDEAFEGIAIAKANAEKNLRNAIDLQSALAGRCFDEHVDATFKPTPLEELCDLIVDCEHKTAPTQESGFPSIRTPNIGEGTLLLDNVNRVSEATYKAWTRRAVPLPGDLILAREAPAGNVAVIPPGLKVCLGQRTVLIRSKRDVFEPKFLAHLLLQRSSQARLLAHSRGATVQHVNMKDIRAFVISHVPSLDVQRRAVDRMADIEEQGQSFANLQSRKLHALDELKKAFLHQAFNGAL
jgi:type I restriction enzyme S subunit